jgi:uncharacterized protein
VQNKVLCLYHNTCYDGFAAAWVAHRYYGDRAEYIPVNYGEPPPDVAGRDVLMVDFSYPRSVMERLVREAATVAVFDHHVSAKEALAGLEGAMCTFDLERSGAGITFDMLFPDEDRPALLNRVEDRDLWRWRYKDSRLVHAALESYDFDFAVWDDLMFATPLETLVEQGVRLDALHWKHIRMLLPITKRTMRIGGHFIPVANVPITLCSDAGLELAQDTVHGYAATYMETAQGRQFSLRSVEDGPNVGKIATHYGKKFGISGGGHVHAAGFVAPRSWEGDTSEEPADTRAGEEAGDEGRVAVAQDS